MIFFEFHILEAMVGESQHVSFTAYIQIPHLGYIDIEQFTVLKFLNQRSFRFDRSEI